MRKKWKVGDKASIKREVTLEVIGDFARISGDYNAIHLDKK